MWICKFKVKEESGVFQDLIQKCAVDLHYYPANYFEKKDRFYFVTLGVVRGNAVSKDKFFKGLEKLKKNERWRRIDALEIEGDFFTMVSSHSIDDESKKYVNLFYNKEFIHYKSVILTKDGWEEWEIASNNRKLIETVLKASRKIYTLKILKLYWKKLSSFGFISMMPELTEKQSNALDFAYSNGYYNYPRKISLDKLAKKIKISFSTFQAHIRKSENKIISYALNSRK